MRLLNKTILAITIITSITTFAEVKSTKPTKVDYLSFRTLMQKEAGSNELLNKGVFIEGNIEALESRLANKEFLTELEVKSIEKKMLLLKQDFKENEKIWKEKYKDQFNKLSYPEAIELKNTVSKIFGEKSKPKVSSSDASRGEPTPLIKQKPGKQNGKNIKASGV